MAASEQRIAELEGAASHQAPPCPVPPMSPSRPHPDEMPSLHGSARQGGGGLAQVAAAPAAPEDHAKLSRERSLQWQEVNSLLEDEIGRMR